MRILKERALPVEGYSESVLYRPRQTEILNVREVKL
jgi:hypothetical protein